MLSFVPLHTVIIYSLTNQRTIIVSSFGFTRLQTTLLGCVDGFVEIVTIFTGVTLAARIPNSRAYVAVAYLIPNILGVFLVNFLPWKDKVGLLFSIWLTGELYFFEPSYFFNVPVAQVSELRASVSDASRQMTTKDLTRLLFAIVLSLSWISSVTSGHTKRVTVNAVMLSAYCIGNSAGPFMWQVSAYPIHPLDLPILTDKQT